jgi:hypothetical protein
MKKLVKIAAVLLAAGIIGLQFIRPERINPLVVEAETLEAATAVPADVRAIIERSCRDCHSNNTDFPWYSNIAPVSWSVVEHITHGREELNFSKWATYTTDKKLRKLDEICDEVRAREMPHSQYLWIHWDAELSENQINILCDWTAKESAALEK